VFRARTAENVAINVGLQWLNRFLGVVTKIVLVRLLFPDDFGVFALASGLIGFVGTFGNFGLDYAIIQKSDQATQEDYDVGMSLRILIAAGLFVVSLVVAGPWASLFGSQIVGPTTQLLALIYLLGIWSFVPATKLVTELRYRAIAVPALAAQVANTVVSILLAVEGFGVWALVWGTVSASAISSASYWALHPWRFRFSLRKKVAAPLMKYAQHLISAAVLAFLITNVDNFTIGKVLDTTQLGFYAVAYGYGYLPVSMFSGPAGQAFFPTLTKIQGDLGLLKRGYLEGFGYAVAIIAPAAIGMAILSPEIVNILFGPVWAPVALPLLILSFYGLFRAVVDFSSSLLGAVGKPKIIAKLNLYILVLSLIPLLPLTIYWGIVGTCVAMTVPVVIVAGISIRQSAKLLGAELSEFYARLRGPVIAAETMGVVVFSLRLVLVGLLPSRVPLPFSSLSVSEVTIVLALAVCAGIVVYFVLLRLVDRPTYDGFRRTVAMVLPRKTPR
jgi:PST family polysaccharide transporter